MKSSLVWNWAKQRSCGILLPFPRFVFFSLGWFTGLSRPDVPISVCFLYYSTKAVVNILSVITFIEAHACFSAIFYAHSCPACSLVCIISLFFLENLFHLHLPIFLSHSLCFQIISGFWVPRLLAGWIHQNL